MISKIILIVTLFPLTLFALEEGFVYMGEIYTTY